jgi:hypothetical protein
LRIPEFDTDQPGILNGPVVMVREPHAGNACRNPCRSCIFATPQLTREQSLLSRFDQIPENYGANINGFWS